MDSSKQAQRAVIQFLSTGVSGTNMPRPGQAYVVITQESTAAALPMGSFPSPPLQPRPVALRFPCVRATKKSTEETPVHRQR
jgi:hypothetical protein